MDIETAAAEISELYLSRKGDQYIYERAIDLMAAVVRAERERTRERLIAYVATMPNDAGPQDVAAALRKETEHV